MLFIVLALVFAFRFGITTRGFVFSGFGLCLSVDAGRLSRLFFRKIWALSQTELVHCALANPCEQSLDFACVLSIDL